MHVEEQFQSWRNMESKQTTKDRKVYSYVADNFSCKICNNILIQCVTLSCGHQFCHYCLDLYLSGKPRQCPQCMRPIQHAHSNGNIDQKIDNLLSTCSEHIQETYAASLDLRFRKTMERSKMKQEQNQSADSKSMNLLDEISAKLKNSEGADQSVAEALKSARKANINATSTRVSPTPRKGLPLLGLKGRADQIAMKSGKEASKSSTDPDLIDADKINTLFGIYDNVLNGGDNEPSNMAGGDFTREHDQVMNEMENPPQVNFEGMQNFTKRSQNELESLIKEADDIIRLDGHIQKWTKKMKDALSENVVTGEGPRREKFGMAEEKFDQKLHAVDDKLWKASTELLEKLQDVRKHGKALTVWETCVIPSIPPAPRSEKLDLGSISDDSDVEEYEKALASLQVGMDSVKIIDNEESKENEAEADKAAENRKDLLKGHFETSATNKPTRTKSLLDCVEESGNDYVKENIEFIKQMRKYKEALMKIQNREVETAQEIRELIPSNLLPNTEQTGECPRLQRHPTPRLLQSGGHMPPVRPFSRSGRTRLPPFSLSTRLPPYVPPTPLGHNRPTTAGPFDQPLKPCQHVAPRQFMQMSNQPKTMSGSRLMSNCRNSLYTAR